MTYHRCCMKSNTTGTTCEERTVYPSWFTWVIPPDSHELTPRLWRKNCISLLIHMSYPSWFTWVNPSVVKKELYIPPDSHELTPRLWRKNCISLLIHMSYPSWFTWVNPSVVKKELYIPPDSHELSLLIHMS